jgi:pimeloyl-ACP methyl ester carboxylesterase
MDTPPIVLVPGFWLGAWAWDEVAAVLRADGHEVTAVTLPGLESTDTDRSRITLTDHVDAICAAVQAAGPRAVLAVHSGTGFAGYAVTDRIPERIAAMVYVDSGPGKGAPQGDAEGVELPAPSQKELEEGENLDGLSDDQLQTFQLRAVPHPGGALREEIALTNDARRDVPSTLICTAWSAEELRAYAAEHDLSWLRGLPELRNVSWIDLPTSHWPMWSRPNELAELIGSITNGARV